MLLVSPTTLVVEQRVGDVELSDLSCLSFGRNLSLTSDDMSDLQRQGIAVDDDNEPDTNKIPDELSQR